MRHAAVPDMGALLRGAGRWRRRRLHQEQATAARTSSTGCNFGRAVLQLSAMR